MRQLRDDTHLILDGEVRVYRRERSKRWQAAFVIDGHTIRISTGKRDLAEAKEYARDTFLEYKFRHKNDLPVVEAATGHTVEIIPVEESDIQTRATAAFAAGDLPNVINLTVNHILPYSEAGLLDTAAASEVMDNLGVDSFAQGPVAMSMSDGEIVAVPTDGWTQLVVYRADMFKAAGLAAPTTFDAMTALHNPPGSCQKKAA